MHPLDRAMSNDAIDNILKNMQGYVDDDEIQEKVRKEAAQQIRNLIEEERFKSYKQGVADEQRKKLREPME